MSYIVEAKHYHTIDQAQLTTGQFVFSPDPTPDLIAKEVEAKLASVAPVPSGLPIHAKFKEYKALVGPVVNTALQTLGQNQNWKIDMNAALPSVDVGTKVWEYREGLSVLYDKPAGSPVVSTPGVTTEYYLNVHPPYDPADDANTCVFCFANDTGLLASDIVLFMTHTRTQVLSIVPVGGVPGARPMTRLSDTILQVPFSSPSDGEVCFEVTYLGDPPYWRDFTLVAARAPRGGRFPVGPFEDPPAAVPPRFAGQLFRFGRTYSEEIAHRVNEIKRVGTDIVAKNFFLELDQTSNPKALPAGQGKGFALLGAYLALRYNARAELVHFGQSTRYDSQELDSWRGKAEPVADHVKALMQAPQHFAGPTNGLDMDAVNGAFDKFARGELTVFETHGAPNGVNYFAFAELAILMTEMRHDAAFWEPLIEVFGRTAEIFAGSYHDCYQKAKACSYQVVNNPTGKRGPDAGELAALHKKWSGPGATAKFDSVVHSALYHDQIMSYVPVPPDPPLTPYTPLTDWGCPPWP